MKNTNTNTKTLASQKSVLVVDDDEFSLAYFSKKLALFGITDIQEAKNGRAASALLRLRPSPPDFLICDVFMRHMDGIEFIAELVKQNYLGGLILVTGVNGDMLEVAADIAVSKKLNVLGAFSKPVPQELLQKALGLALT